MSGLDLPGSDLQLKPRGGGGGEVTLVKTELLPNTALFLSPTCMLQSHFNTGRLQVFITHYSST